MVPRTIATVLAVLMLSVFGAVEAAAQRAAADTTSYTLHAGDRVTIELYTSAGVEVVVVDGERIIDDNGEVFLPFVGNVQAAGLNANRLRALLTERYSEFYTDPVVDIEVDLRISITGSVGTQGEYFVDPTTTIFQAIALAGGMPAEVAVNSLVLPADQARVTLVRDGRTLILNLRPSELTNDVRLMRVRSGDWIYVPPGPRSSVRDQITFWGGVLSFLTSIVSLLILANR